MIEPSCLEKIESLPAETRDSEVVAFLNEVDTQWYRHSHRQECRWFLVHTEILSHVDVVPEFDGVHS